jgi:hypothetical protein
MDMNLVWSAANTLGVLVLGFLHVSNKKAIAVTNAVVKLAADGVQAAPGGFAGELKAAPVLITDAAAVAQALNAPNS